MKRHLSDSEPEVTDNMDDYEECSSPDTAQVVSRKKRRGIIEKRRRDRINNCLMELRRLVPAAFEKQGSAKLEKAEILQMSVDHLRHLHQSRDPRGFADPFSAYGNTRAFLDYRIMGFRECVAESARYLTSVEGLDMKDPLRVRMLNHLESYLAQRELAINAAVAASAQMGIPKIQTQPTTVNVSAAPLSYAPLTPPRASPDHLSPPAGFSGEGPLPRFSLAFPAPVISFASTATVPVFGAAPSSFKPVAPPVSIANPTPIHITTIKQEKPQSPTPLNKTAIMTSTKAPFRPWADTADTS